MRTMMLMLMAVTACAHATQTADQNERQAQGQRKRPAAATTHATSKTTKQMFKPDGLKRLQLALASKGDVDVKETGTLDKQTQDALRRYQKEQGIAETGLPDYEAVRRLGLEPDDVFYHEPPAERVGVK